MLKIRAGILVLAVAVVAGVVVWGAKPAIHASKAVESPPVTVNPPEAPEPDRYNQSDFLVEVLVNGYPQEAYFGRGRQYIEAQENQEYSLRIRNPLGVRVAVALSVDGLNTIDATHTSPESAAKWVIEPYDSITITGWQMSGSRARQFYFTTERNSYGAKLGQTANLGVISAVFFRERAPATIYKQPRVTEDDGGDRRSDSTAPSASNRGEAGKSRNGSVYPGPDDQSASTGIGRNRRNDVSWVHLDLESRATAEVNIRYEYHDALVRLGHTPAAIFTGTGHPEPPRTRDWV